MATYNPPFNGPLFESMSPDDGNGNQPGGPNEWPTTPYPPEESPEILPGEIEQPLDPEWPGVPQVPPVPERPVTPPPPNTENPPMPPF